MLIVIGVVSGALLGAFVAAVWGLRRTERAGSEVLLLVLALFPALYFYGAGPLGWPTPGSIAVSAGAVTEPADRWLLTGTGVATAVVAVGVLVAAGATRRLEKWARRPE